MTRISTPLSSAAAQKTPPRPSSRWRKIGRRAGIALLGLLILLLVVFFLLPVWISNEQGRTYVLQRINRRLNASAAPGSPGPINLAIGDWSLGWFRGTVLRDLRVQTADGRPLLSCPTVDSGMTLWDLLWGNYDLRTTTADALQVTIVKYRDGRTSWNDLVAATADDLRSLRGALQINGADVTVESERSGERAHYSDVKASLTIASAESPFHIQISAVGATPQDGGSLPAGAAGPGRTRDLSINATFPAIRDLIQTALPSPSSASSPPPPPMRLWSLIGDVEFSANNVPTELFCDCFGLQQGWADSFGQLIDNVRFSNHGGLAQDVSRPLLTFRGRGVRDGLPFETQLDLRARLRMPDETGGGSGGLLTIPVDGASPDDPEPYQCQAALRMSPNLARLLQRINPLLGEARERAGGPARLTRISVSGLSLPLDDLRRAQGNARLTFPPLSFDDTDRSSRAGRGIIAQLRSVTTQERDRLDGTASLLRVHLGDGAFDYQNFVVTFGHATLNFGGTAALDGHLDLVALIPSLPMPGGPSELSSGNMQIVITGSAEAPVVHRAE
jgi:hypothetical protein